MHRSIRASALLSLLLPAAGLAQQAAEPPTVTVGASATVEREPDRAVVTLAVESEAPMAQAASQANAAAMSRVITALRRAGLTGTSVRTISVQLMPVYAPTTDGNKPPKITGYRAVNMVQATIDSIPRVGPVIDAAISAGANRVAGISFELKDAESARLEALAKAVEKARREADVVARAAGRRLGPALNISFGGDVSPPRPYYAERAMAMAQAAETPVEGGTLQISANVNVVFRLDPL
jgi:uncharacterized protein YggE